jgi:hypothetical protein
MSNNRFSQQGQAILETLMALTVFVIAVAGGSSLFFKMWTQLKCQVQLYENTRAAANDSTPSLTQVLSSVRIHTTSTSTLGTIHCLKGESRIEIPDLEKWKPHL